MKTILINIFLICFSLITNSQNIYLVGSDHGSIEPEKSIFSSALAGYGAPSEGRFTIQWKFFQTLPNLVYLTGIENKLYGINQHGEILRRDTTNSKNRWLKIGQQKSDTLLAGLSSNSFKLLTGFNQKLYAISLDNHLYTYDLSDKSKDWVKGEKIPDAITITSANNNFYIITPDNILLKGTFTEKGIFWEEKAQTKPEVLSLISYDGYLYVVTRNQRIWKYCLTKEENAWMNVGYFNGETYSEYIKHLAILDGRLFGTNLNNDLFISQNTSEGDLSVRSVVISDGTKTIALISLDICTIDYKLSSEIKSEISKVTGIQPVAILINVTHTHFAPLSRNWESFGASGIPDNRFNDQLKKATIKATLGAMAKMEKSELSFGRTKTLIGFNRSLKVKNIDNSLDIVKINNLNGVLNNVIFLTGCHPVFPNKDLYSYTISPNYPGTARKFIEETTLAKTSVFLQGCGGDINPRFEDYKTTGEILGSEVALRMEESMEKISGQISFSFDSLLVQLNIPSKEQIVSIKTKNSHRTGDINAEMFVRWSDLHLCKLDKNLIPSHVPIYIQTINIGNWKLIGLSREPVNSYSKEIKNLFPNEIVSIIGYSNDVSSYLPDSNHVIKKTYEGHDSFYWYGMPGIFPKDIDSRIVEKIKSKTYITH
ncbi:hypothetical protein JS578_07160 [Dysgonomonadaceae bacterium zrk40]|nr:hypothetical protein JS578_07160 [Dysgonomonadaceae bacterium zrk40]